MGHASVEASAGRSLSDCGKVSREKNQLVTFVPGANQVIAGVDEGVTGIAEIVK